MASLNSSLEELLTAGGDTRLEINPHTGRNGYACLRRPGDAVPFGSCTSSTVSQLGFTAARQVHQLMSGSRDSFLAADECAERVRQRLRELLTLPGDVDIALAPSGTDTELLALALAAGAGNRRVLNVVVGPSEVGSGTPLAAACRHYDRLTPVGRPAVVGEAVDPALASLVDVRTIHLRTPNGDMLSESEIDAAILDVAVEASDLDAVLLLHIVAHSKTGVHAPSSSFVERLRKTSNDVVLVVDAAQGRFSRRGLRDALRQEYLVMITGSKFYGGPAFSGALLVPRKYHPANRQLDNLPEGYGAYFSSIEMPRTWPEVRASLPAEPNFGALLRWTAAIAEVEAYYNVPSDARLRVLRFFESEVPKIFGGSDCIRLLPVFPPLYDDASDRLLESKTTVFGFWVTPPGRRHSLDKIELKKLHLDLSTNVSDLHRNLDSCVLREEYHLGQPVDLGQAGCVLRVALGGTLITRISTDRTIGESFDARLNWLRNRLLGLRQKIECLASLSLPSSVSHSELAVAGALSMAEITSLQEAFTAR